MASKLIVPASLSAILLALAGPADAARSYDNCSGFVDSVPATITTQGVWCLRADLSTAISSGAAISINTNNVTLDCNDFKLGGLGAGTGSSATGIFSAHSNTTVRNCNIRGFLYGLAINSDGGNLVESNRFDQNRLFGVAVEGPGSIIRDNQVVETGGSTATFGAAIGIFAADGTDVIGNSVTGVTAIGNTATTFGIQIGGGLAAQVMGNFVKGVVENAPSGSSSGIYLLGAGRLIIRDNSILGNGITNGSGIRCTGAQSFAFDNVVNGYPNAINNCTDGGNGVNPN